jgi:single-strand DNA-binding protein
MARSLNKVQLIGNLTRDPELRYTPQGTAVCTFGLATNRQWTTESGEKKEDAEFHRIVAWNKLAEICSQLLTKGRKAYIEGRLQTRSWQGQDGAQRTTTEIVASDMIILDSRREGAVGAAGGEIEIPDEIPPAEVPEEPAQNQEKPEKGAKKVGKKSPSPKKGEESEDIPF